MVKQRKILVADDDRITREMLGAILKKAGHEVVFAEDGKAALEAVTNERPDMVLIDGLMPRMHGFLACKAIKELDHAPKVVLLTGVYTKPSYKWEAKGAFGADDLLKKPSTPDELLACIEKQLPPETGSEAESTGKLFEERARADGEDLPVDRVLAEIRTETIA
jgi:CheY-like chemotaxis protein